LLTYIKSAQNLNSFPAQSIVMNKFLGIIKDASSISDNIKRELNFIYDLSHIKQNEETNERLFNLYKSGYQINQIYNVEISNIKKNIDDIWTRYINLYLDAGISKDILNEIHENAINNYNDK
jgi:hypothetical protein